MMTSNQVKRIIVDAGCNAFGITQYNVVSSKEFNYSWFRIAKNGSSTIWPMLIEQTNPDLNGFDYPYFKKYHQIQPHHCHHGLSGEQCIKRY